MAKFAKCGYGSRGQGLGATTDGYTYVVNDNVRTGDRIQVVATNHWSKKKFATTAVPLSASIYSENTLKGQLAKQEVESKTGKEPTRSYTGAEEGLSRKGITQKEYQKEVRGLQLAKYKENNPNTELSKNAQDTFDSYSKKFMGKGE